VLTIQEVHQILDTVRTPHNKAFLWTVYSLGLRLHNGNVFSLLAQVDPVPPTRLVPRCAACGGPLIVVGFTPGLAPLTFDTS
jgi:hypothetical protein